MFQTAGIVSYLLGANMGWLDIVIIVVLMITALIGFKRGFTKTVLPLVGIILGLFLAGRFCAPMAGWLSSWLESPNQSTIVAFAVIFILVTVVALALSSLMNRLLRLMLLGWVDRLGGAVFGLAIGGLIPAILLAVLTSSHFFSVEDTVRDSSVAAFLLDRFYFVLGLLPQEFDSMRQFFA